MTAAPGENTPKSNLKTALLQFDALLFEEYAPAVVGKLFCPPQLAQTA